MKYRSHPHASPVTWHALAVAFGLCFAIATPSLVIADQPSAAAGATALSYPPTRTVDMVDEYFGRKVSDPYRWLENLDSPETADWVAAENNVTFGYLEKIPERESIRKRLTALWDFRRTDVPTLEAGEVWFAQNSGLQRQAPVYRQATIESNPILVIDPNALSPDGSVAMGQWSPSPDGRYLAYTRAPGGSDVEDIYVRDIAAGKDIARPVLHTKFGGIAWTHDSKGFFYSRFKGTEIEEKFSDASRFHQVWYHHLDDEAPDRLVFERPDHPTDGTFAWLSDDGRWIFIAAQSGTTNNRLWIADLASSAKPNISATPVMLASEEDAIHVPLGIVGRTVYLYTTYMAPKGRIVSAAVGESNRATWRTVVPEAKDPIADAGALLVGDRIVVTYFVDVQSRVRLFTLDGSPKGEIPLPEVGSVMQLAGRNDGRDLYLMFTSYLRPRTVYRYSPADAALQPFYAPTSPFDASRYETRALFYTSKDGTRIPIFITLRKGAALDGSHPLMLYGYGGFNSAEVPRFSPAVAGWLELGGIYAVANIRGGSEYGEEWHRAGTRERKQNVFDDFIAAAEFLIKEKYTSPSRLVTRGGSNGGLLVAATMVQRPDLFAVALPAVGVLDMMRYHRFSAGTFWIDDYGSSDEDKAAQYLLTYSPLHNLKPHTCYPATLLTTADRDDRVVPAHSFKFAAALQAVQSCANPTLIRVEIAGSHGYRPTDRVIAEVADQWAFALHNVQPAAH